MMSGEKRDAIRAEVKAIEDRNGGGRVTPDQVLERAKSKTSALHDRFEWDDKKAGHKYRVEQARALINSVCVVIHTDRTIVRAVAYVRDPAASGNEQGYRSVQSLRSEPDVAREALLNETIRVKDSLRRVKALAVAFDMSDEVNAMLESVIEFEQRVPIGAG